MPSNLKTVAVVRKLKLVLTAVGREVSLGAQSVGCGAQNGTKRQERRSLTDLEAPPLVLQGLGTGTACSQDTNGSHQEEPSVSGRWRSGDTSLQK